MSIKSTTKFIQVGLFISIMPWVLELNMSALHLQNIFEAFAEHLRNVCRKFANHLRENRTSAARQDRRSFANVARNEGCYFWTPLYVLVKKNLKNPYF
jgi:hypothetical protein